MQPSQKKTKPCTVSKDKARIMARKTNGETTDLADQRHLYWRLKLLLFSHILLELAITAWWYGRHLHVWIIYSFSCFCEMNIAQKCASCVIAAGMPTRANSRWRCCFVSSVVVLNEWQTSAVIFQHYVGFYFECNVKIYCDIQQPLCWMSLFSSESWLLEPVHLRVTHDYLTTLFAATEFFSDLGWNCHTTCLCRAVWITACDERDSYQPVFRDI